jgi:GTPase
MRRRAVVGQLGPVLLEKLDLLLPRSAAVARSFSSSSSPIDAGDTYVASVALAGAPNAGKSTLCNALMGRKLSAVSAKTNTTARIRLGCFTDGPVQVTIYDTPGIVEVGQYRDQKHGERVETAWAVARETHANLLVVDAFRQYTRPDPRVVSVLETFREKVAGNARTALVLSKIDKLVAHDVDYSRMRDDLYRISGVDDVFCVSGLRGHGVGELRSYMCGLAEPGAWTTDEPSSAPESVVTEAIREKVFRAYYKEIPYSVLIRDVSVTDGASKAEDAVVRAVLSVPTSSMRTVVVGSKGAAIQAVERAASIDLRRAFGKNVRVVLKVVVGSRSS